MAERPHGIVIVGRAREVLTVCIAMTALGIARPSVAADTPLLMLPTGAATTLTLAEKQENGEVDFSIRVPVTVAADKNINVQLAAVSYKDALGQEVFQRFKVVLDQTAETPKALVVSYQGSTPWPGTYALTLRVSEKSKTAPPATPSEVVLNVQVPAPQLSGPTKLALSFTIDSLWATSGEADQGSGSKGRLQLAERSGKNGAFDLVPVEFHDVPADADTGTGTLTYSPVKMSVPANAASAVDVSTSGNFPLGITKGKIEWMSPSLTAPQVVPFELKVTRSRWWIMGIALAGVLLGFVLRSLLTDLQARLTARAAVTLSLLHASRALEGRADSAYRNSLNNIVVSLREALVGNDAKIMLEVAKNTADEIRSLSDALEARFPPARDKLNDINAVVNQQLHLPDPVATSVKRLLEQIRCGNELLQQRDMTEVEALLRRLSGQEIPDLIRAASNFAANLVRFLQDTAAEPFPMSVPATQLLRDLASEAASARQALASSTAPAVNEARTLLLCTDALWRRCLGFAEDAEALSRELCDNAKVRLKPWPEAEQAFAPVQDVSIAAARRFAADVRALGIDEVAGGHQPLVTEWLNFLLHIAPTVLPATLRPLLVQSAWLDALTLAIDARNAATVAAGQAVPSALAIVEPDASATVAARDRQPSLRVASGANIDSTQPTLRAEDLSHQRKALVRRNWQTELLRSLGVGAIFVLGSYFVYADEWIGTYKEMATLFVLAFGLDLTGDGVAAALKKT